MFLVVFEANFYHEPRLISSLNEKADPAVTLDKQGIASNSTAQALQERTTACTESGVAFDPLEIQTADLEAKSGAFRRTDLETSANFFLSLRETKKISTAFSHFCHPCAFAYPRVQ